MLTKIGYTIFLMALILFAIDGDALAVHDSNVSGTIKISGDDNEVEWDEESVSSWDAYGNVSLEFTDTDGNITTLTGDSLSYRRQMEDGVNRFYILITGDVVLVQSAYKLTAETIEGFLDPIELNFDGDVNFSTTDVDLEGEKITFIETGENEYWIESPDTAKLLIQRDVLPSEPTELTAAGSSFPFPVEMNFDFKTILIDAPQSTLVFRDGVLVHSEFPYGIVGETDTDYVFSTGLLTMSGYDQISGENCRIIGPEAVIRTAKMDIDTSGRIVQFSDGASIISEGGSLSMDGLTIVYDDEGIRNLKAKGNIVLDFSLTLTDEDIFLRPLVPDDIKRVEKEQEEE